MTANLAERLAAHREHRELKGASKEALELYAEAEAAARRAEDLERELLDAQRRYQVLLTSLEIQP